MASPSNSVLDQGVTISTDSTSLAEGADYLKDVSQLLPPYDGLRTNGCIILYESLNFPNEYF